MISKKNFAEQSALFARLSNVAYKSPDEAKKLFKLLGFTSTYYDNRGSEAYVIEDDTDIIIVCRGTEPNEWSDIKADLNIDRVPSRSGDGQVHRGFRTYVDKIWEPIKHHILDTEKTVWLAGHSLGGAMATLMARRFVLEPINIKVEALFTFGSPRVGNRTYINSFNDKITHHRWVNEGDIVTKIPFSPFYYHCGKKHHIGKNGIIINNIKDVFILSRTVLLSVDWIKGLCNLLLNDVKSHSSELYVKHISSWATN